MTAFRHVLWFSTLTTSEPLCRTIATCGAANGGAQGTWAPSETLGIFSHKHSAFAAINGGKWQ